jgi:peptidoglycan hydrolase CwlO-like protein
MKKSWILIFCASAVFFCFAAGLFCQAGRGSDSKYEIRPQITLPDNYLQNNPAQTEHLLTENSRQLSQLSEDIQDISRKLDSIDNKLTQLSARIAYIEAACSVKKQPPLPAGKASAITKTAEPNQTGGNLP